MDKASDAQRVKYTGQHTYPGFMDVSRIINYKGGNYGVLSGRDEMFEAITSGIARFVGPSTTWSAAFVRFGARWRPATLRTLARCSTRPLS